MKKTKEQMESIRTRLSSYGFRFKELKLSKLHIFIVKEKEIRKPEILEYVIEYFSLGIVDPIIRLVGAILLLFLAVFYLPIFIIETVYELIKSLLGISHIKFLIERGDV